MFVTPIELIWVKRKPSGSIARIGKQQPRFYWSCSSVVMKDATQLTCWAHGRTVTLFSNVNNIQSIIPEVQKNVSTQCSCMGWHFAAATQAQNTSCSLLNYTEKRKSLQEFIQNTKIHLIFMFPFTNKKYRFMSLKYIRVYTTNCDQTIVYIIVQGIKLRNWNNIL